MSVNEGLAPDGQYLAGKHGLSPEAYHQLKHLAHAQLRSYRKGGTLNNTALVHEAFIKLLESQAPIPAKQSSHFFAVASMAMRQILVDYTRQRHAGKRGGGALHVTLQESSVAADAPTIDLLALDEALNKLAIHDPDLEKLVVLRFFGGLNMEQVAANLGRATRSVERDWTRARVYLYSYLQTDA